MTRLSLARSPMVRAREISAASRSSSRDGSTHSDLQWVHRRAARGGRARSAHSSRARAWLECARTSPRPTTLPTSRRHHTRTIARYAPGTHGDTLRDMGEDERDPERTSANDAPSDPDRAAILARRQRFIAFALSGLASTACDKPAPQPCLSPPQPPPTSAVTASSSTPQPCLSPPPLPPPDAGPPASPDSSPPEPDSSAPMPPRPCLKVAPPPPDPRPSPQPCLRVRPSQPQPCLMVYPPQEPEPPKTTPPKPESEP
jgi:hypothetical protein